MGVGDNVVVGYTESEFVESVGGRVCIVGVLLGKTIVGTSVGRTGAGVSFDDTKVGDTDGLRDG